MPIDLSAPFRGSTAIAAGLLTPGVLRGRRYRRLFPDVYAPAVLEVDLALRARAAGVLVAGRGVVAGYAAAELWGASCGPADAPVDVLLPHDRRCDGLRVHRERIDPDEITWLGPTLVTTADRAAFDLARWAPDLTERVAAVDALARCCKVEPDAIRALRNRHLGVHHGAVIAQVLALADAQAASPVEQGDADSTPPRRAPGARGAASRDRSWYPVLPRPGLPGGAARDRVRRRGAPHPAAGPPRPDAGSCADRAGLAHRQR
jgi:hypothetical protein